MLIKNKKVVIWSLIVLACAVFFVYVIKKVVEFGNEVNEVESYDSEASDNKQKIDNISQSKKDGWFNKPCSTNEYKIENIEENGLPKMQSLVCMLNDREDILIEDLSSIPELDLVYKDKNNAMFIYNFIQVLDSKYLLLGYGRRRSDAINPNFFLLSISDKKFTLLKSVKHSYEAIRSPDGQYYTSLTKEGFLTCNLIKDRCSNEIKVLSPDESLSPDPTESSMGDFDISWMDNDTLRYKVYYKNYFDPAFPTQTRKFKEYREINIVKLTTGI